MGGPLGVRLRQATSCWSPQETLETGHFFFYFKDIHTFKSISICENIQRSTFHQFHTPFVPSAYGYTTTH